MKDSCKSAERRQPIKEKMAGRRKGNVQKKKANEHIKR